MSEMASSSKSLFVFAMHVIEVNQVFHVCGPYVYMHTDFCARFAERKPKGSRKEVGRLEACAHHG